MATIKAIEARTVHQIQSGQVIVDLCSVVKELVENSLDAGATNIEVRFKNQGLDSIEVQDNGSGISKENYETLALKHYTSKLSTYADLTSLQTFGFRGEALSSLCALSKFTVTTCLASDAPKGSRLEFETSGKLRSTSVVAAQKGTTVSIEGLFQNLPVRRRELERNIKREWNKVIGVLNQYACIKTGLKFSVSQQPNKGKRMVLFSTKGNQTTRENIVNVFGSKTLAVLIPLDLKLELELTSKPGQRWSSENDSGVKQIHIRGHVSRPAHGEGRQTPDRQMFFVNGRPCGLPQFAKVFNEVYKSYNASQSPFIFADIQLDTDLYDVNVSPDKRTILLHDQTRMLDNLREALATLFESQDYALPASQLQGPKQTPYKKPPFSKKDTSVSENGPKPSMLVDDTCRAESVSADPEPSSEQGTKDVDEQSQGTSTRQCSTSLESLACSPTTSLMGRWAERKYDAHAEDYPKAKVLVDHGAISAPKERRVSKISRESTEESQTDDIENAAQTSPTPTQDPTESPNAVDFRARLEELSKLKADQRKNGPEVSGLDVTEPPIPAISAPSRVPEVKVNKAVPPSSMKRAAPEVATITIGDHTITSIIGSPSKKQRLDTYKTRNQPTQRVAKEAGPVPSFKGRLTQMFAADAKTKHTEQRETEFTAEMSGVSEHSDSSDEQLFIDGDEEEDEDDGGKEETGSQIETDDVQSCPDNDHDTREVSPAPDDRDSPQRNISPSPSHEGEEEYVDDDEQRAQEDDGIQSMGEVDEDSAEKASEEIQKRTQSFVKGGTKKKDATYQFLQTLRIDGNSIRTALTSHQDYIGGLSSETGSKLVTGKLDAEDAEEKLSLTISKSDFGRMKIIGQFNLGFIIATRPAKSRSGQTEDRHARDDELFIIDQHATDEKYNFERLQASTVVQSQRLVQPKALELTAVEEEVIRENIEALEANGFMVSFDDSGYQPVGSRCQLLSLPLSRETTFSLADLEELVSLLTDHQSSSAGAVPRPSKVRRMFAMRACRSSVMIGKPLSGRQMEKLVRHMGELDKPWNCPHGRPTMRHLCGLGAWDEMAWREGDGLDGERASSTDWGTYVREKNGSG
ncbi:hypothetical protein F5X99DRAFT_412823 [Biscogniauxia marginata]|nr:hypothetical protein F5X99DRAFT_412823 [Biscogniauxia marginata]